MQNGGLQGWWNVLDEQVEFLLLSQDILVLKIRNRDFLLQNTGVVEISLGFFCVSDVFISDQRRASFGEMSHVFELSEFGELLEQ